ncbi:glycyl radical protein [Chloroflexota bacterium]
MESTVAAAISNGGIEESLRKRILDSLRIARLRIERALIVTQSHKETEGEPMIIRRAKAFHDLANKMPISIEDWQLIVGNFSAEPFALNPSPEVCWRTIIAGLDGFATREGDKYLVTEEDKKILREILPWWDGKSIEDMGLAMLPLEAKEAFEARLTDTGFFTSGNGSFVTDYKKVLSRGLASIMKEIEGKISELDLADPQDYDKWLYYQATLICCDAAIDYARRYAELAREQAEDETRAENKERLLLIAQNCERVPEYPAQNFFEALQAYWFVYVLLHYEGSGTSGIVAGRIDQLFYPYIKGINRSEVKKWLENLWINCNQSMYFLPGRTSYIFSGHPMSEQPTLGGVDENGEDASNELTEMMLEVEKEVGLPQPDVGVMYHKKISRDVLEKSCDALSVSMKPKFFNYEIAVKHALERGIAKEDIKDLVSVGCVNSAPQGKIWGNHGWIFLSLGKALELALNNGVDVLTGKKIGVETGDPQKFDTFDKVMDAFKRQLQHAVRMAVILGNVAEKAHAELNPQPFASVFVDDCLEKGLPPWKGGARYNIPGIVGVGLANIANSFAALKKLVFEDRVISMAELLEALHSDFEGKWERLRQRLIHDAPKFGNDDDYVDKIAVDMAGFYCKEIRKFKCNRGSSYYPALYSVSAHVGLGKYAGALPDGRKARMPMADGMSPAQEVCFKGPTAVIKSVAKIDHVAACNGTLLNMKFSAATLKNPATREKFIQLLEAFMELGGYHAQFNIIDTAKLKDAQEHPDKYPDLLVRVAAYVAQFGGLPRDLQNDIIARSEMGFG